MTYKFLTNSLDSVGTSGADERIMFSLYPGPEGVVVSTPTGDDTTHVNWLVSHTEGCTPAGRTMDYRSTIEPEERSLSLMTEEKCPCLCGNHL